MLDAGHAVLYHPAGSAIFNLNHASNRELKEGFGGIVGNGKYQSIPLTRENDVFTFELAVDVPASRQANVAPPGNQASEGFARPR